MCYVSYVMCEASRVMCHMSHVACHMLPMPAAKPREPPPANSPIIQSRLVHSRYWCFYAHRSKVQLQVRECRIFRL